MDELTLTIPYQHEPLELPLKAYPYGYTYRIAVQYGADELIFEPDEQGSFRAFAPPHTDKNLIALIAAALEQNRPQ